MRAFVLDHPIETAVTLLVAAGAFRLVDIFVLRLAVFVVVMLLGIALIEWTARTLNLPIAEPWGA